MKDGKFELKEWVLVRDSIDGVWALAQFSNMWDDLFIVIGGLSWNYCIPYNEETKHLLGTTDDCDKPYVPKDGDFVVADDSKDSTIFVYNEKYSNPKYHGTYIGLYRGRNDLSLWKSDAWCDRHRKLRLATEEEKQLLLSKLEEIGKVWNAEKKCIEEYKWKPKSDEQYWFISDLLIVDDRYWDDDEYDYERIKAGNCFRTKEEAQAMADKFKELLKGE